MKTLIFGREGRRRRKEIRKVFFLVTNHAFALGNFILDRVLVGVSVQTKLYGKQRRRGTWGDIS